MTKKRKTKVSPEAPRRNTSGSRAMKITPLGDRVLVKPVSDEELSKKNQYGIIIPETVDKEKPEQGTVVAVGDGRVEDGQTIPVKVKVGDKILFSKYGYDDVKVDEEEYYILKEENILAVIR
jgi:chaperonin GroES